MNYNVLAMYDDLLSESKIFKSNLIDINDKEDVMNFIENNFKTYSFNKLLKVLILSSNDNIPYVHKEYKVEKPEDKLV